MTHYKDDKIIIDSNTDCWAVSYLTDGKKGKIVSRRFYFPYLTMLLDDLVDKHVKLVAIGDRESKER